MRTLHSQYDRAAEELKQAQEDFNAIYEVYATALARVRRAERKANDLFHELFKEREARRCS